MTLASTAIGGDGVSGGDASAENARLQKEVARLEKENARLEKENAHARERLDHLQKMRAKNRQERERQDAILLGALQEAMQYDVRASIEAFFPPSTGAV